MADATALFYVERGHRAEARLTLAPSSLGRLQSGLLTDPNCWVQMPPFAGLEPSESPLSSRYASRVPCRLHAVALDRR